MTSLRRPAVVLASARNAIWPLLRRTRYRLLTAVRDNPLDADTLGPVVDALADAEATLIGRDPELKRRRGRGPRMADEPVGSEEALRQQIRKLERELREREEYLAIVAHDLRNPLAPVLLMANRLSEEVRRRDVETLPITWLRPRVETISKRLEDFLSRLNRLLDVTRLQSGHISLAPEGLDLVEVVRQVVADARQQASGLIEITVDGVEALPGRWDRDRVMQIIANLLSNAVRYGSMQPVSITIARTGDLARIVIRDHGIGIASEDHGRIFERCVRLSRSSAGMGLGLWIVRELCEAMGGAVTVDSHFGKGATFTVTLPLHIERA